MEKAPKEYSAEEMESAEKEIQEAIDNANKSIDQITTELEQLYSSKFDMTLKHNGEKVATVGSNLDALSQYLKNRPQT